MHLPETSDAPPMEARAFRALHEIAVAIAGVLDQAELARLVTDHARELLAANAAVLHGWFDEPDGFRELNTSRTDAGLMGGILRMGQGIAGQAALQRSIVVIDDYPNWPLAVASAVESGFWSGLGGAVGVGGAGGGGRG